MRIQFITGTDTGVGKTVWTAHWLHALRRRGEQALAMKPFCSGGRGDVRILQRLQRGMLTMAECNPWYFKRPLAPAVAAKEEGRRVGLGEAVRKVEGVAARCETLLVEGAGGVLVPLGRGWTVLDWIVRLEARVVVVARNRLGTINHTLLTVRALEGAGVGEVRVVLMDPEPGSGDASVRSNREVLGGILGRRRVGRCPWLGSQPTGEKALRENLKKVEKLLAHF